MKSWLILLMLSVSLIARGAETNTNLLSIHLLADPSRWGNFTNLSTLELVTEPVITDADIVAYDITNNEFAISAEAGSRLAKAIWQSKREAPWVRMNGDYELIPFDTPYVAVSFGERLCVGWFTSSTSSTIYFNHPTIKPGLGSYCINTNATTNVWLELRQCYSCMAPSPRSQTPEHIRKAAVEIFQRSKQANESLASSNRLRFFFDNLVFTNQSIRIR